MANEILGLGVKEGCSAKGRIVGESAEWGRTWCQWDTATVGAGQGSMAENFCLGFHSWLRHVRTWGGAVRADGELKVSWAHP